MPSSSSQDTVVVEAAGTTAVPVKVLALMEADGEVLAEVDETFPITDEAVAAAVAAAAAVVVVVSEVGFDDS
jgi:uncharacterized protein (DUF433 family)